MAGATGLDYSALAALMDMQEIKHKKRASLLRKIQLMESEVLAMWAAERDKK